MNRQPSPVRNLNLNLFALGNIALIVVARALDLIPLSLAFLLIVAIVWFMARVRTSEKRRPLRGAAPGVARAEPGCRTRRVGAAAGRAPRRSGWSIAGMVLAFGAAIGGLAILATAILLFVALSTGNFSNK